MTVMQRKQSFRFGEIWVGLGHIRALAKVRYLEPQNLNSVPNHYGINAAQTVSESKR